MSSTHTILNGLLTAVFVMCFAVIIGTTNWGGTGGSVNATSSQVESCYLIKPSVTPPADNVPVSLTTFSSYTYTEFVPNEVVCSYLAQDVESGNITLTQPGYYTGFIVLSGMAGVGYGPSNACDFALVPFNGVPSYLVTPNYYGFPAYGRIEYVPINQITFRFYYNSTTPLQLVMQLACRLQPAQTVTISISFIRMSNFLLL